MDHSFRAFAEDQAIRGMLLTAHVLGLRLRPVVPSMLLFSASVPYAVAVVSWTVVSKILPRRWFAIVDDFMWGMYQRFILFFFETATGANVYFYGDYEECFKKKENVVYLSNHQSSMDWMIADILAIRQGSLGNIRYMLKEELKWVPLYGWYFYLHGCVYVRRGRGAFRSDIAERSLNYLASAEGIPFWMVIFPEGTRYSASKPHLLQKSQQFALQQGFAPLKYHYMPRTRGLQLILSHLRPRLDAVYDVTVIYTNTLAAKKGGKSAERLDAPSMFGLVMAPSSEEIHIHVRRIPVGDVPLENDAQATLGWLYDRYLAKETYFREFLDSDSPTIFADSNRSRRRLPLRFRDTVPPAIFFITVTAGCLSTAALRQAYVISGIVCTLGGYVYMWWTEAA